MRNSKCEGLFMSSDSMTTRLTRVMKLEVLSMLGAINLATSKLEALLPLGRKTSLLINDQRRPSRVTIVANGLTLLHLKASLRFRELPFGKLVVVVVGLGVEVVGVNRAEDIVTLSVVGGD